jgi:NTE family protein
MNVQTKPSVGGAQRLLPFERIALVLQGGGALGAYQAGVYEALAESGIEPDWIAGISIGGIIGAIIAGNPPNTRVDRLREFWTQVTSEAAKSARMTRADVGGPSTTLGSIAGRRFAGYYSR